ncbi:MAG: heat shock protein HspQ [Sneathiella sp.]|nr:heat shock protein HspQ [Sneathiella sp.]
MEQQKAEFQIGQIVHHVLFDYIGVVFDVDPVFDSTDEWYDLVARSRPPKDKPWYHVLVNDAEHTTYVAQQNLEPSETLEKIQHPLAEVFFHPFDGKKYEKRQRIN